MYKVTLEMFPVKIIIVRYLVTDLLRCKARSRGLVVKAHGSPHEVVGLNPGAGKLDGCYVGCFNQHNPPVTIE